MAVGPSAAGGEQLGDDEVPASAAVHAAYFCLHS